MTVLLVIPYILCGLLAAFIFNRLLPKTDKDKEYEKILAVIWGPLGLMWALFSLFYFKKVLKKKPYDDTQLEFKKMKLKDPISK